MGELNSESKPYSLKAHPKSITLPAIKNKETPENTVNTPFPRATTFIFLLTDILLPHGAFVGTDPRVGQLSLCSLFR